MVSTGPLEAPHASAREVELNSVLEWVNMAMDGEAVSDFAMSFPIVARAVSLYAESQTRSGVVVDTSSDGEFTIVTVSSDGVLEGRGTSRKPKNALSYALEDLAQKVKNS